MTMAENAEKVTYRGKGEQQTGKSADIRPVDQSPLTDPSKYQASRELAAAVNVALELGMPLLLTGEPGCGKSELAASVAWELDFPIPPDEKRHAPLSFSVKSDTDSRDLFYRFDTLGRFHAAQSEMGDPDPRRFIAYQALGLAILLAKGRDKVPHTLLQGGDWPTGETTPQRAVVLIDEIDKAPREVPNDILNEVQKLSFKVPELARYHSEPIAIDKGDPRPFILITSNGERPLPQAFLRRCVYFHVEPPPYRSEDRQTVTIESIVTARLGDRFANKPHWLQDALSLYQHIRESPLIEKKPSVAELLSWLYFLSQQPVSGEARLDEHPAFAVSVAVTLFKLKDDQNKAAELIGRWQENRAR